jgi:hypothetical protein
VGSSASWSSSPRLSHLATTCLVTACTVQGTARARAGQAPPCPWILPGVPVEVSGVKHDFACAFVPLSTAGCPAATVMLEAGGARTYTQRAIPGPEPGPAGMVANPCITPVTASWPIARAKGSMVTCQLRNLKDPALPRARSSERLNSALDRVRTFRTPSWKPTILQTAPLRTPKAQTIVPSEAFCIAKVARRTGCSVIACIPRLADHPARGIGVRRGNSIGGRSIR